MVRSILLLSAIFVSASLSGCSAGLFQAGCNTCNGGSRFHCNSCDGGYPMLGYGRPLRRALSCGSGCGEVYVDEWLNHPPICNPCDYRIGRGPFALFGSQNRCCETCYGYEGYDYGCGSGDLMFGRACCDYGSCNDCASCGDVGCGSCSEIGCNSCGASEIGFDTGIPVEGVVSGPVQVPGGIVMPGGTAKPAPPHLESSLAAPTPAPMAAPAHTEHHSSSRADGDGGHATKTVYRTKPRTAPRTFQPTKHPYQSSPRFIR